MSEKPKYVINKYVSMEWETRGFYVKSSRATKGERFYFAAHEYDSTNGGKVCLIFTPTLCCIFTDGEVTDRPWTMGEIMRMASKKDAITDRFPYDYEDNYFPVHDPYQFEGKGFTNVKLMERLGISQHLDDIKERIDDLHDYGVLVDTEM